EAKAFLGLGWTPAWDAESIATSRWLADDRTMFWGVRKLAPGHWMEIGPESALSELRTRQYWDQQYSTNVAGDNGGKHDEASVARMVQSVREKLVDAVRVRLRADVPMGLYLSGGIDSSAVAGIVAHLVSQEGRKFGSCGRDDAGHPPRIKCFTVGYTDATYDESDIAAGTVKWLSERFGLQVECHRLEMDEQKLADNFEDSVYHTEHHIFDLNTTAKSALSSLPREHGIRFLARGRPQRGRLGPSRRRPAAGAAVARDFRNDRHSQAARSGDAPAGCRTGSQKRHDASRSAFAVPAGKDLCRLGGRRAGIRAGLEAPFLLRRQRQDGALASAP
ncbi:hypothetical protein G3M48_002536, partial [Beauveria asiatica]